ncbi:MAG: hypothetical protein ACO1RT_20555 [Planctomycetaceae bacterium]
MNLNTSRVVKTLVWKELRENVHWLPLGLFVVSVVCWMVAPSPHNPSSRGPVAEALIVHFVIVTPLFAFVLGIVQSYRDLQPSAAAYLLHRGVTVRQVFLAKATAGLALYTVAIAVPVLCLVAWVASQGMERYPMRPAQVVPALVLAVAAFGMHPAAMMMMSRQASWWGTRLVPLAPAAAMLIAFFAALRNGGLWAAGVCILIAGPWILWLIAIASQSWRQSTGESPRQSTQGLRGRWLTPAYLVLGLLLCLVAGVVSGLGVIEQAERPDIYVRQPYASVVVDEATGEPWMATIAQSIDPQTGIQEESILGADRVEQNKLVDPMRPSVPDRRFRRLVRLSPIGETYYSWNDGFFSSLQALEGTPFLYSYDTRGYLICYSRNPSLTWTQTLSTEGFSPRDSLPGKPFTANPAAAGEVIFNPFRLARYSTPLIDTQGVYVLSANPLSMRTLIEQPIEAAALLEAEKPRAPRLIVQSGRKLFEYQFVDVNGAEDWYPPPAADGSRRSLGNRTLADLELSAKLVNTYELPGGVQGSGYLQLVQSDKGLYAVAYDRPTRILRLSPAVGKTPASYETIAFTVPKQAIPDSQQDRVRGTVLFSGLFPGVFGLVLASISTWLSVTGRVEPPLWEYVAQYPIQSTTLFISFALVNLLAIWLTALVAHRRGLNRRQRITWYLSTLLLGLAAPLSVVALYPRVLREPCSKCDRLRRVDVATCEHCGADWEPPLREGIEICDRDPHRSYSSGAAV